MYNWLGQEVEVGSVVGRGARSGNTSEFKVGLVTELFEDSGQARVFWKYTSSASWETLPDGVYDDGHRRFKRGDFHGFIPYSGWGVTPEGNKGSKCTVESLFVLDDSVLERAAKLADLVERVRDMQANGIPVSKQQWLDSVATL